MDIIDLLNSRAGMELEISSLGRGGVWGQGGESLAPGVWQLELGPRAPDS